MSMGDEYADWCRRQQTSLRHQLAKLDAGKLRTWEQRSGMPGMVDTTAETGKQVKNSLAELDALLAGHPAEPAIS